MAKWTINDLVYELLERGWEFYTSHDESDDYFLGIILGNQEYIIYNDSEAERFLNNILENY